MEVLIILFLFAITLHNLEEAIWLPAWSNDASKYHKPVGKNEFHFAVICITALAYLSAFFYLYNPDSLLAKYILSGFLGSMLLNAIFPHLLVTILQKRYAPGLLTGILLNIPINGFILYRFIKSNEITLTEVIFSTLLVAVLLVGLIPVLFRIGKSITNQYE
ncbi:HXXEE domain-containing protein [Paenibacillus sp. ACRRX]|uniref:HXXEE domain-containing protein n=1 Tax=unclassified Paenibacillus TaxID=185978 RepID=UPI001EF46A6B|nr:MULTISPECIES: HXXEE domain-containing protein [unclassified Paenibacillus]MCG7410501.1 HXXEE domain-containing protein [Paenibacillus sp. ACRRX]MDK8183925.1 HXXEE domain-containing protein [Paenibacillus sp. UMB4589-SE434]